LITGLFSVFLGTFFAIRQKRIKRLLIYSSIGQIGFLVVGLTTNTIDGFSSVLFFLFIYLISSILIWNHITLFYSFQKSVNLFNKFLIAPLFLSNLSNFFETNKLWSLSLVILFFSFAGIPPLSGFLSKFLILYGLIQKQDVWVAVFLILISVISVFYYIRVIKILFFEKKKIGTLNIKFQTIFSNYLMEVDVLVLVFGLFLLLFFFFFPTMLLLITQYLVLSNILI
jgi:NADH:ubiquinone oxidoreductase subunit 2 (subunit N)